MLPGLSPQAPARTSLKLALDAFLKECEERRELRSVRVPQADAPYPDDAS